MFAQCITAMAHHQYLELEGGHKLVEFIVRQCAVSDEEVGGVVRPSCTAMFNRPCYVQQALQSRYSCTSASAWCQL